MSYAHLDRINLQGLKSLFGALKLQKTVTLEPCTLYNPQIGVSMTLLLDP